MLCAYMLSRQVNSTRNINPSSVYQRATHVRRYRHNKKPKFPKLNVITLTWHNADTVRQASSSNVYDQHVTDIV